MPTTITLPTLVEGEAYAGILLNAEGAPTHHLILLPGEAEDLTWEKAKDWAAEAGGELPTRAEQALLYANAKAGFEGDWYWSCEQHASDAGYAWGQTFYHGGQGYNYPGSRLRARAVRRLVI